MRLLVDVDLLRMLVGDVRAEGLRLCKLLGTEGAFVHVFDGSRIWDVVGLFGTLRIFDRRFNFSGDILSFKDDLDGSQLGLDRLQARVQFGNAFGEL